jgi:exodeoxyribonuclease VII small subunit
MDEMERDGTSFATRMTALEQVVSDLESGDLSLEDALRAFEKGIVLVRALDAQLNEAEHRIELLMRTEDGRLELRPAAEDED